MTRTEAGATAVERLRRICLALPGVTERVSHGEATFFAAGKRMFLTTSDHHHDDRLAFWCAAPEGVQGLLVREAPDRYFAPPYVGSRGWLGVWLDVKVDWQEIAGLVERAHLQVSRRR